MPRRRGAVSAPRPAPHSVLPAAAAWVAVLDETLIDQLASAARGPKREGLFALWLVARTAADAAEQFAVEPLIWCARHEALVHRLQSLALSAPLRRALATAMSTLQSPTAANGLLVLSQLTAPVRDVLGDAPADALTAAVSAARVVVTTRSA